MTLNDVVQYFFKIIHAHIQDWAKMEADLEQPKCWLVRPFCFQLASRSHRRTRKDLPRTSFLVSWCHQSLGTGYETRGDQIYGRDGRSSIAEMQPRWKWLEQLWPVCTRSMLRSEINILNKLKLIQNLLS